MNKIEVEIKLFGAFRKYGSLPIRFEFSEAKTSAEVKAVLGEYLQKTFPEFDKELVQTSVLANDKMVLSHSNLIEQSCQLAVLPPVCGG